MNTFRISALAVASIITSALISSSAHGAPDSSEFKKLSSKRAVSIANCAVSGVSEAVTLKISLSGKKADVALPASFKRSSAIIGPKGSNFAACGASDTDPTTTVLYLKSTKNGAPTEYPLSLAQFEESEGVGGACGSVRSWPGAFIYKTIGSHHFTDIRRNTIGLIMKYGANVATPKCIDVITKDGTKVGDFGFYARGAGWFARYYGGVGCGDAINGNALASRARKASGSDTIYVRIGSACYGPISASRCVGSKAC